MDLCCPSCTKKCASWIEFICFHVNCFVNFNNLSRWNLGSSLRQNCSLNNAYQLPHNDRYEYRQCQSVSEGIKAYLVSNDCYKLSNLLLTQWNTIKTKWVWAHQGQNKSAHRQRKTMATSMLSSPFSRSFFLIILWSIPAVLSTSVLGNSKRFSPLCCDYWKDRLLAIIWISPSGSC